MMETQTPPLTVDEFLAWETHQEHRYEFAHGSVSLLPGGTSSHEALAGIVLARLIAALPRGRWRAYGPGMAIVTASSSHYADVVYTDDERDLRDKFARKIAFPKLIVEVLSPSTGGNDRGEKFDEYRSIPTFEEYVLLDSRRRAATTYRKSGAEWVIGPTLATGLLHLTSVPVTLDLDELYGYAGFDDEPPAA